MGASPMLVSLTPLSFAYERKDSYRTIEFNEPIFNYYLPQSHSQTFTEDSLTITNENPSMFSVKKGNYRISVAVLEDSCTLPLVCLTEQGAPKIDIEESKVMMNCTQFSLDGWLIRLPPAVSPPPAPLLRPGPRRGHASLLHHA